MKQIDKELYALAVMTEPSKTKCKTVRESFDNLPDCNCSALGQRVGELEEDMLEYLQTNISLEWDNIELRKALEELEVKSKWLDELLDILKCESIDDAKAKCRLVMSILKLTEALKEV